MPSESLKKLQKLTKEYTQEKANLAKTWGEEYEEASQNTQEILERINDPSYFIKLAATPDILFKHNDNFFSFSNFPGIFGGCWWHSRFQRASIYLTTYRPEKQRPTPEEAQKIIKKIRYGHNVVEINGFRNFAEFSYVYKDLIQKVIIKWQLCDGILLFQWINGLRGKLKINPKKLRKIMDNLYVEVAEKKNISYVKLKIKRMVAHSWLITEMSRTNEGYKFKFVDSNFPRRPIEYCTQDETTGEFREYRYGDTSLHMLHLSFSLKSVPYLQKKRELKRYKKAIKKYQESHSN